MKKWDRVLTEKEVRQSWISHVREKDEKTGSFLEFNPPEGKREGDGILNDIPFGVKDNIAVENYKLTCGSKMLENVLSPYNATVIQKLLDAGAVPVGKCNMDEFGMGSSTDNSALGKTNNPWDSERVAGGSSGGSAAAVSAGFVPFALGSDTGGSIRQPASFCGVFGLKPTYGSVSRYGLVAYGSSLEVIGVLGESSEICEKVFTVMKGQDVKDNSSVKHEASGKIIDKPVVAILKDLSDMDKATSTVYKQTIDRLKEMGYTIKEVEMPTLEYVVPAYYTIATAEASANLARFNGIRYGYRTDYSENPEELVKKSRTEAFGDEVKSRILLGTYVLRSGFQDQYYTKAQKIRTAIRLEFDSVFESADLILSPVFPVQAFKHGESGMDQFQQKLADKFTASVNLAGIPAMSFPAGHINDLPVGMQFMAPVFEEDRLFRACEQFSQVWPQPKKPGFTEGVK